MNLNENKTYEAFDMLVSTEVIESLERYIEHWIPTGGFLQAVIENNLSEAVGRADENNIRIIPAIVAYLYNEAPARCWGREGCFDEWIESKQQEKKGATK